MRRAPLLLWRHVSGELWRLILMTACILVTVLAFAAAVRFLADGRLGPIETIRLMFLAMPPMLQYALPFAAGFGATLAYHRACVDNELTAGFAAGISLRSILVPALASGAVLAVVVLTLSNLVIPRFLRSMEELVTRDAARLIIGSIERKEAVTMDNTLLYADLVRKHEDTGGGAYEKLHLQGVFFVELNKDGSIKSQGTAREATVWLQRVDRSLLPASEAGFLGSSQTVTRVIVQTKGMSGRKQREGWINDESNAFSKVIPNAFSDDPKFLTGTELIELRRHPDKVNFIDSRRRELAARLAERATTGAIVRALAEHGMVRLTSGEDTGVTIYATSIRWDPTVGVEHWVFGSPALADGKVAPILVERRTETGRTIRQRAEAATFRTAVDPNSPQREVTVELTLAGLSAPQGTGGAGGTDVPVPAGTQLKEQTLADLGVPDADIGSIMSVSSAELLVAADKRMAADPKDDYVQVKRDELRRRIADLMREISSKQHERWASAVACLVMILTGAVMAVKLRTKLPLQVYLWAFFPALATVIAISAGQQMIHSKGWIGVPLMWAGVVGLAVYTFMQYRQVARR